MQSMIIASPDEKLGRDLAGSLTGLYQLGVTTTLQQVPFLLSSGRVDLMLLDVRTETDPASTARTILASQQSPALSPRTVLIVTPQQTDTLKHLQGDQVALYAGAISMVELRALISRTLAALPETTSSLTTSRAPSSAPATGTPVTPAALAPATPVPSVPVPVPSAPVPSAALSSVSAPAPSASAPEDAGQAPRSEPARTLHQSAEEETVYEGVTRRFETRSPELRAMLDDLIIAARHDVTILLIGETGSGKTFLSNLVHEASPRKTEPFLHIACGALPRDLLESELFGHVKGAFTSAHADKQGKFLAARRGTILLDEIDVLGPEQQVKLLRVIETGEFEPVGSNQTYRSQARLVVASNLNLEPLVDQGRFRPDLYYRLNMLKFEIPPLRKRKVDIIPLARKFITKFGEKHSIPIHSIDDAVLEALLSYPWPGNVRELEHVMQRAVIYCRNGQLSREHLPPHLLSGRVGPTNDASVQLGISPVHSTHSLECQVAVSEKEIIEQALLKNNFSRTRTAVDLGISRVTLYNKMKKYQMLK
jgi:DNA-binding NtrC family response regulator